MPFFKLPYFILAITCLLFSCSGEEKIKENASSTLSIQEIQRNQDLSLVKQSAILKIEEFESLMNYISVISTDSLERVLAMKKSYQHTEEKIFGGPEIIIEDDINPAHTAQSKVKDISVERYLEDLNLFYEKSEYPSIKFSNIQAFDVKEKENWYVLVYFESTFDSQHSIHTLPYQGNARVATIEAKQQESGDWELQIVGVSFFAPSLYPNFQPLS